MPEANGSPAPADPRTVWIHMHQHLDFLMAAYAVHTGRLFGQSTILDLMEWSYRQTQEPCPGGEECRCKEVRSP